MPKAEVIITEDDQGFTKLWIPEVVHSTTVDMLRDFMGYNRRRNIVHALHTLKQDDFEWPHANPNPYGSKTWAEDHWNDDDRLAFDECLCDLCDTACGEFLGEDEATGHPRAEWREVARHEHLILCEDCWSNMPPSPAM